MHKYKYKSKYGCEAHVEILRPTRRARAIRVRSQHDAAYAPIVEEWDLALRWATASSARLHHLEERNVTRCERPKSLANCIGRPSSIRSADGHEACWGRAVVFESRARKRTAAKEKEALYTAAAVHADEVHACCCSPASHVYTSCSAIDAASNLSLAPVGECSSTASTAVLRRS